MRPTELIGVQGFPRWHAIVFPALPARVASPMCLRSSEPRGCRPLRKLHGLPKLRPSNQHWRQSVQKAISPLGVRHGSNRERPRVAQDVLSRGINLQHTSTHKTRHVHTSKPRNNQLPKKSLRHRWFRGILFDMLMIPSVFPSGPRMLCGEQKLQLPANTRRLCSRRDHHKSSCAQELATLAFLTIHLLKGAFSLAVHTFQMSQCCPRHSLRLLLKT
mmetsp:Transcript_64697/g.102589  ORF Transcript_64697/g.102589 Transcript_64697/m.102589 type:complete len:217 (+) Transcript_64697:882-1532(+)